MPQHEEKLYCLVDSRLSRSQQAVQSAHGVAQWCLEYPYAWRNGTLVLLKVPEPRQWILANGIRANGKFTQFREPDWDNRVTCVVGMGWEEIAKNLPLL